MTSGKSLSLVEIHPLFAYFVHFSAVFPLLLPGGGIQWQLDSGCVLKIFAR
jgi:hypothetical protein